MLTFSEKLLVGMVVVLVGLTLLPRLWATPPPQTTPEAAIKSGPVQLAAPEPALRPGDGRESPAGRDRWSAHAARLRTRGSGS